MSKIVSVDEALDLIHDGDLVASSAFIQAGCAEYLMRSIGERYTSTGHPSSITLMFAGSAGCYTGGMGHDHLCHDGLIGRVIGGHFGLAPGLGKFMAANKCLAYNFPLGIVPALYRDAIQGRKYHLSKVGLKTFMDPRLEGGRINDITTEDLIQVVEFEGEEWLRYPVPKINIGLIRGTTGDADGNVTIDHEVGNMEMRTIAMAAHACGGKVIVQVKDLAAPGTLTADKVEIPGVFVDAVVVCPEPEKEHRQTVGYYYDSSMAGHINIPLSAIPPLPLDIRKVLVRRAAMQLMPSAVVNLGIGIPEGVAMVMAEEGLGDQLTLTTESGIMGGIPCGGGGFGAGQNAMGHLDMRSMFDFYDGGGLNLTVLGLAEVNPKGDVNVGRFGVKNPGCGGFINISQNTRKVVFCGAFTAGGLELEIGGGVLKILKEGKSKKFVSKVQQVTYSGEYGASIDQDVIYVTERAVFRLTKGGIVLIEIAPGIDLERNIIGQMEFKPIVSPDLKLMDSRIFREEQMGLTI